MTVTVPDGRYQADLERVGVARDDRRGRWVLSLGVARDDGARLVAVQPAAAIDSADPFALSAAQLVAWHKFAADAGIDAAQERSPREVVARLERMVGRRVTVRVNRALGVAACRILPPEPRAPTPAEIERAARHAHGRLIAACRRENEALVAQAAACYELRHAWPAVADDGTVSDYLDRAGVRFGRSTFYERAQNWERFVEVGGVDPALLAAVEPGKLRIVRAAVDGGLVDAEDAIRDAGRMTSRDLTVRYAAICAHHQPLEEAA